MANPFDQFDAPTPPQQSSPALSREGFYDGRMHINIAPGRQSEAKANPFDQFDPPADKTTASGLAHNAVLGVNQGIAGALGAPVDLMAGALNLGIRGVNAAAGSEIPQIEKPFGGSESIMGGMRAVGVEGPQDVTANSPYEKVARGAGEGLGMMTTGAGLVAGAKTAGALGSRTIQALEGIFGRPNTGTAAIGTASGAGGEIGGQLAPEGYEGAGRMTGSLAVGAIPIGGMVAVQAARGVGQAARNFAEPFTRAGQERIAGRTINNAATEPQAVRDSLSGGSREIVPGSMPTTFQQTGDMGLGQLERAVRTKAPDRFIAREASQNAARQESLSNVQQGGSPLAVAEHFRGLRDALDQQTEAVLTGARRSADRTISGLGGGGTPEGYGAQFRDLAQSARDAAKANERALWKAVDPSNNMIMPGSSIAGTAREIESRLSNSARPLSGEERAIFDAAQRYGHNTQFRDVTDLRSRVSAAMREERRSAGQTPAYARMAELRSSIEKAIDNAVENRAAYEAEAVASGRLENTDTMAARVQAWQDDFYRRQKDAAIGLNGDRGGDTIRPGGGQNASVGLLRAEGEGGGRPSPIAGGERVPSQDGVPLDDAAASRLKAASAATRERASTFDQGSVGSTLKPGAVSGEYRLPTSAVPAKIFHPGPTGGEDVRGFVRAVGERNAMPALNEYAAFSLRKASVRPDGSLDPAKVRNWISQHADALREMPAQLRNNYLFAARAEDSVAAAIADKRTALATFDKSAAARLLGLRDEGDVVRQVGSILNGKTAARDMGELVAGTKLANGSVAAKEGLRRAAVEYIDKTFVSTAESATTGRGTLKSNEFQKFMNQKDDALAKLFEPDQLRLMKAVALDLQRANRSIVSTKLPGGSNTAQDMAALGSQSIIGRMAAEAAASGAGGHAAGLGGGVMGWLGVKAAGALRDAGLARIDNLIQEAMLNPSLAKALLAKVPTLPDTGSASTLGARLRQLAIASSVEASKAQ